MNALVTNEASPTAGPHGEGLNLFSPWRQAEFLQHLQLFGSRSNYGPTRGGAFAGFVSDGTAR